MTSHGTRGHWKRGSTFGIASPFPHQWPIGLAGAVNRRLFLYVRASPKLNLVRAVLHVRSAYDTPRLVDISAPSRLSAPTHKALEGDIYQVIMVC